jgi:hypothetical protein
VGCPPHPTRGDHLHSRPSAGSELKVDKISTNIVLIVDKMNTNAPSAGSL